MNKREILKTISKAKLFVMKDIKSSSQHGKYGAGLAREGYAGGYLDALNDVEALLTHGFPNYNSRYMWKDEQLGEKD